MNEEDLIMAEALFNITNYTWKVSGNYHIGDAIDNAKKHNQTNLIIMLSYDDAIDSMGNAVLTEMPKAGNRGERIGAVATTMFILAHGV